MRWLGVDFGEKRIGLAISDREGRLATPLATLRRSSDARAVEEIRELAESEEVEGIVIGEPRRRDGTRGDAAARVHGFARKLRDATRLPVRLTDELLTTREAAARLGARGRDRDRLDALAAQILLQQALDEPGAVVDLADASRDRDQR